MTTDTDPYTRPAVFIEDDGAGGEQVVYRASSLGYCKGALARARLGLTPSLPPEWMAERFQEGHDWEREVLGAGLGADWIEVAESELPRIGKVLDSGQVEVEIAWGGEGARRVVRCHPDAIVRRSAVDRAKGELAPLHVCEVKFLAADSAVAMSGGPEPDWEYLSDAYRWQAAVEMHATGLPMLYVIGAKERDGDGKVTGIAWTTAMEFATPPYSLVDIKMRVAEIEGAVARGSMPGCPVPFDFPCGYWQDHPVRKTTLDEEITDDVLVHLIASYARNRAKAEAIATECEAIRGDIDGRLAELELPGGMCSGWRVSVTEPRPGNVSWARWAKEVQKKHPEVSDVDVEKYRGDEVLAGVRIEKPK